MDKKKIDNLTNQFENLKFKKELDKKIQAMLAIDKLARKEKNLKEDSKKVISPKNLGKKWKSNREKRRLEKEKEKEDRLLRSITKMYGYDGEEEDYTDLGFGKKQKKDIKGMLTKILLYGGIPTLLLVSLGILSNTKLKGNKQKTKVKKSVGEQIFKNKFVNNIKKIIEEKYKNKRNKDTSQLQSDLNNLKYILKQKLATKKRHARRNASINLVLFPEDPKSIIISPRDLWRNNKNNTKTPTTDRQGLNTILKTGSNILDNNKIKPKPKQYITFNRDKTYIYSSEGKYYIKGNIVYNKNNVAQKKFSIREGSIFYEKNKGGKITEYPLKHKKE
tara:strand:- start:3 stop:1001 length:999 start_codon:yes stop_codon:yes gene_type:complete